MNTTTSRPVALAHQRLHIGQLVHVNYQASWLPATITTLSPRAVGVAYTGPAHAAHLAKTVAPQVVQPADGIRLCRARNLAFGDAVVFANSTRTVARTPWMGRDGWLIVPLTEGMPVTVVPNAVLRLRDNGFTPAVTVNGVPLALAVTA